MEGLTDAAVIAERYGVPLEMVLGRVAWSGPQPNG